MSDDFDLRLRHLGPLQQATVFLEGAAAAWHLELIIIADSTTGERQVPLHLLPTRAMICCAAAWHLGCSWLTVMQTTQNAIKPTKPGSIIQLMLQVVPPLRQLVGQRCRLV